VNRFPNIAEECAFTLALLMEAPPEIWFYWITGEDDVVYEYLEDLE
jgi:hypothetical protein